MPPLTSDAADLVPGDLFPCGLLLLSRRIIQACNASFADMFGYRQEDLIGHSMELLYPSRREFLDTGDRWLDTLHNHEQVGDERVMVAKGGVPIWCAARGRSNDRSDPFSLVACVLESRQPLSARIRNLTPREREIFAAMGEGLTSKEIARRLGLSFRSVETYRLRMLRRLGARNSAQLFQLLRSA